MNVLVLLHAFGSASLFASRLFVPMLLTAGLLRFGERLPLVAELGLLAGHGAPAWFTSDACLLVLVALSALELAADRFPELQSWGAEIEPWLKPTLAAATSLGVLQTSDAAFAGALLGLAPSLAAASTWGAVQLRAPLVAAVRHADPDDALHLQRAWRWLETSWVLVGALLLLVLPMVVALLLVAAGAGLALVRRRVRARADAARGPCPGCGAPVWLAAPCCAACGASQRAPRAVGALGQVLETPAPADHPALLVGQLRCPRCAARLQRSKPQQTCSACGTEPFGSAAALDEALAAQARRLPQRLAVVFVSSLVPVAGYIAAAAWSGLVIEAPLRVHLPLRARLTTRLWLRLLRAVVIVLQLAPLLGAVVATAEGWLRWRVLSAALREACAGPGASRQAV